MIDILRVKDCTEVFTDPEKITETYRDLVKIYHPDSPTGSSDKMIKLQELYLHAKNMKKSGKYMKTDQLMFFKYGTNEKEVFQIDVSKCAFLNTEKFLRDQIFSHDTKTRKLKRISDLDPDTFLSVKDPSKHC